MDYTTASYFEGAGYFYFFVFEFPAQAETHNEELFLARGGVTAAASGALNCSSTST